MSTETAVRPEWLPKEWDHVARSILCDFCHAATPRFEGHAVYYADHGTAEYRSYWFCDDCSDRAKAAICGGDE